jgi:NADPH2:quinone reductase
MSGFVVKLGAGVTAPEIGQAVFVSAREMSARGGCYAEFVCAEADALYVVPSGMDMEAVAALSNYQVAWHLLHSAPHGVPYDSILLTLAAGGVGSALVQLAKCAGKQVIGLVDTDERADFVRSMGAVEAINLRTENVTRRVHEITAGRGVDLIFDSIGGRGLADQADRLAPFGTVVCFGSLDGPPTGDVIEAMFKRMGGCLAVRFFSMHAFDQDRPKRREVTAAILQLLAAEKIKPPIWARLPLAEAGKAQALLEGGKVLGKIILKPS